MKKYGAAACAQLNGELLRSEDPPRSSTCADLKERIANYDEMPARALNTCSAAWSVTIQRLDRAAGA